MHSQITGQLVSHVTVQVAWANKSGAWNYQSFQAINFVVVPRKGETIFFMKQKKYVNVIDVIHQIGPKAPMVIVVVQARA